MEELKVKMILSLLGLSLRRLPLLLNKFARFSGLPFFLAEYGSVSRKPFCCPIFQRSFATFSLLRGEYRGRTDDLLHAMQAL